MKDFEPDRRAPRSASPAGWIVALLGLLVLVASYRLGPDSEFGAASSGLRVVAWLGIALGLLLVVFMQRRRSHGVGPRIEPSHDVDDDAQAGMTRPSVLAALGVARAPSVPEPSFVDTIAVMPPEAQDAEDDMGDAEGAPAERAPVRLSPLLLQHLDWQHFTALCRSFFAQAGFATSVAGGADEQHGADVWVQSRHMPEPRLVRCRQWQDAPVDAREMREFLRAMSAQGLQHGTYVCGATFTAEAADFAKANGIQVQDGAALLRLISHRTAEQQRQLLAVALGQEPAAPTTAAG
ncbi:restriction endonuclease [Variovorax sp.]|uniref:restriction endonuclease n=1 Tax=Variovorax sp. TaxID=1871043 RepID=UPI002D385F1C|nr:restriction endonuclease [Variovorax sp.]HYP83995.1 restriction endonuclease [Variovorax sp.]